MWSWLAILTSSKTAKVGGVAGDTLEVRTWQNRGATLLATGDNRNSVTIDRAGT